MLNNASLPDAWIGLSDNLEEGVFRWRDGTYANYTRWGPIEPNGNLSENCVYLYNHWWLDSPCNVGVPFICEKEGWLLFFFLFKKKSSEVLQAVQPCDTDVTFLCYRYFVICWLRKWTGKLNLDLH